MLRLEVFEVEKVKSKKGDAEWEECRTCGAAACTKDECDLAACDYIMRRVMGGTRLEEEEKQRLEEEQEKQRLEELEEVD
jgi:hypothetical protein